MKTQKIAPSARSFLSCLLMAGMLGGCASAPSNPDDPWEGWNRDAQDFNDGFDKHILKPMAKGYVDITSDAVDEGVTNFFSNINDIGVTINDLLQFKLLQGGMDLSRFLINTTAGVVGIFDVASMIDLPKHNEDFEQTLGVWGVPSGPYFVLPFWGPSSPRGMVGLIGDALTDPLNYTLFFGTAASFASTASDVVDVTDTRAGLMSTEKIVDEAAIDRYEFIKESYQQHVEYLINDGVVPEQDDSLDLDLDLEMEPDMGLESDDAVPEHKLELSVPEKK
ncbi:MAG: ABC transporter [Gammaproteobacteria bacterium HGW-Gammaproteobacteria-3]|nr:MAG: ABC transporter [Gammaproteobacteria bacterium HGW-Gammaproteobacteria-3]